MNKSTKLFLAVLATAVTISSCKKKSSDDDDSTTPTPTPTTITIDSPTQVSCKVNGTAVSFITSNTALYDGHGSDNSLVPLPDTSSFSYEYWILNVADDSTNFSVKKGTLKHAGVPPSEAAFNGFFATGNYNISNNDNLNFSGVIISLRYNGVLYSSNKGIAGTQSGSTFKIEERKTETQGFDSVSIIKTLCFSLALFYFKRTATLCSGYTFIGRI